MFCSVADRGFAVGDLALYQGKAQHLWSQWLTVLMQCLATPVREVLAE